MIKLSLQRVLWLAASLAVQQTNTALAQSSASAFTVGYRYDAMNHVTGVISPDPGDVSSPVYAATRNTYDSMGRLTKVEKGALSSWQSEAIAPASWSGFTIYTTVDTTYDLAGNKLQDTTSSGGTATEVTQYSYDALDRLDCTAERMNPAVFGSLPSSACTMGTTGSDGPDRISKNIYDAANELQQVRKAVGTSSPNLEQAYATYSYTSNGKRKDIVDAKGNHALQVYDEFDRLYQWQFPSTTGPTAFDPSTPATALATAGAVNSSDYEQYGYDQNFNRTSLRKRDSNTIGYSYDPLNRAVAKDIPGGFSADVYYGYDLLGHQLFARFTSASGAGITNSYDGFGRLTSSANNTGGTSRILSYQYDADSNRTRITHPDGTYFTTDYDGLDRQTVTRENGSTAIVTLGYNTQVLPASISRMSSAASTSYGYDGVERLNSLTHDFSGSGNDQSWGLAYNPASQIKTLTSANDAFAWNGGVNASNNYTPNGLNQYASVASASFSYDANGNLTSDGSTAYGYDVENRLISASGAHAAGLSYDPNGRLFQTGMTSSTGPLWGSGITFGPSSSNPFNWTAGSTTGTTQFLYDGDALVAEYDAVGNLLRRYVHGPDPDEPLVWYEGAGLSDRRFLHADHQGSVVATSDSSGAAGNISSYDEYGIRGTSNTGRFQYTGQIWLPEVALYHYKARAYSPILGRFMQTDPVGYHDQINLYAYVGNDPTNRTDPSGKCGPFCGILIGGAVGGIYSSVEYLITDRNDLTVGGFLGHLGEGALVGAVVGSGAGFFATAAAGAGAHTISELATAASKGSSGMSEHYGNDGVDTAVRIASDAGAGAFDATLGKAVTGGFANKAANFARNRIRKGAAYARVKQAAVSGMTRSAGEHLVEGVYEAGKTARDLLLSQTSQGDAGRQSKPPQACTGSHLPVSTFCAPLNRAQPTN